MVQRGGSILMGTTVFENEALLKADFEEFGIDMVVSMF
jgi:hypothetical protein